MSRMGVSSRSRSSGPVAGVYRSAVGFHVVVLTASGGRPAWRVAEARSFPAGADAEVGRFIHASSVGRVVRVVTAEAAIARTAMLPLVAGEDNDAQVAGALRLLAEAELPATLPGHRVGAGVIGPPAPDGSRTALLTGWVGGEPPPPLTRLDESWATPAACLAVLWDGRGVAVWTRHDPGVAVCIAESPTRAIVRAVRIDEPAADEFRHEVGVLVAETLRAAESDAVVPADLGEGLRLEGSSQSSLRARIGGVREDQHWLDEYGLALGAAELGAAPALAQAGLASLTALPPRERYTLPARVAAWVATPRHAWLALAAAVTLLVAAPPAFAYLRHVILRARVQEINERSGGRDELEKKAALYGELEQSRWPMAKLLNDLSTAAPVGITVQNLRLAPGQGLTLKGVARSQELVTQFQAALNRTKVFGGVTVSRTEFRDSGVEFDLTAQVVGPSVPVQLARDEDLEKNTDYAGHSLAERLYGPGASNDTVGEGAARPPGRSRRDRTAGGEAPRAGDPAAGERRPSPSETVPPPLTDEQVARMDRTTAMREWTTRQRAAVTLRNIDAATKQRLQDEARKCKERFDQTKAEGGG